MKVLYIHGYQASPSKQKVDILSKYFDSVTAPLIDWDDEEDRKHLFSDLIKIIKRKGITHIIGSSMGGQMAFYLITYLNKTGLCFNPSFNGRYKDYNFEVNRYFNKKVLIDLGKHDNVVSPQKTIKFLQESEFSKSNIVINYIDSGHTINLKIFEDSIQKLINL